MAIAQEYVYAENKAKALGGTEKKWLREFHRSFDRMQQILHEKGIDARTTLKDKGLVSKLTVEAKHYNLDSILGFYEIMAIYPDTSKGVDAIKHASNVLGISVKSIRKVYEDVKTLFGPEYIALSQDIHKYSDYEIENNLSRRII